MQMHNSWKYQKKRDEGIIEQFVRRLDSGNLYPLSISDRPEMSVDMHINVFV